MTLRQRRALVTGVTGFVGGSLIQRLARDGWVVRGSSRAPPRTGLGLREVEVVVTGPLGPATDWSRAVDGVSVVFHLASRVHQRNEHGNAADRAYRTENVEGTVALAKAAAQAGVERFVFASTVKVQGGERAEPYSEADAPRPTDAYGASKLEAEVALRQIERDMGMSAFIVRPPLVYGPGVRANFLSLLRLADSGLPLPLGSVTNSRSLIAVDNLADALACCADADGPGRTYLVSDGDDVSTAELIRRLGSALGRPTRLFPFPPALLETVLRLSGLGGVASRMLGSLRVDSSAIRRELGWRPPVSMIEELSLMSAWYRAGRSLEDAR